MADDEPTTRLHWPSDPLAPFDAGATERRPAPPEPSPVGEAAPVAELAALRAELEELRGIVAGMAGQDLHALRVAVDEVRGEVAALREAVAGAAEVATLAGDAAALTELRDEMVALRRRISLRGQGAEAPLDDAQLERVVASVLDHIQSRPVVRPGRRHR